MIYLRPQYAVLNFDTPVQEAKSARLTLCGFILPNLADHTSVSDVFVELWPGIIFLLTLNVSSTYNKMFNSIITAQTLFS